MLVTSFSDGYDEPGCVENTEKVDLVPEILQIELVRKPSRPYSKPMTAIIVHLSRKKHLWVFSNI